MKRTENDPKVDRSSNKDDQKKGEHARRPHTKVETDTGKRPEKDTNPLPPNPNKIDNH